MIGFSALNYKTMCYKKKYVCVCNDSKNIVPLIYKLRFSQMIILDPTSFSFEHKKEEGNLTRILSPQNTSSHLVYFLKK